MRGLLSLVTIVLLCSNIILVEGQRGRVARNNMTRWTPRTSTSSTTTPTTTTESSNNSTSAITTDKNKVAPENEKDVLPTNITLAKEDVIEITTTSSTTTSTIPTTTTTEKPERQESEEVVLVHAVSPKKEKDVVVRAENLKEATRGEKVTAKRDLPFLIQSSPGIVSMNIESHRRHCTWAVYIVPDTHLEWITVFYRNNNSNTKVSTC